jgi:phenylpropionate dioxygenase-like ring-hydroxylating dioxygenase large terminal subunit
VPSGAYTSPEFFEFEKNSIFYKEWLCIGHQGQIPNSGDVFTITIVDEPLVATRADDGAIRVFSAICPHRGFPVIRGAQHEKSSCDKLVCPYHRWTFDLTGQLLGAPYMNQTLDKDALRAETRLLEFRVEVVQGFIFVNFDPEAAPLRPSLAKFEAECANYDIANMVPMPSLVREDLPFNWKIMHENALEPYHTMFVHDGYHDMAPANLTDFLPFDQGDGQIMHPTGFAKGATGMNPLETAFFPLIPTLTEAQKNRAMYGSVPPTMFFSLKPDQAFFFLILPTAVDRMTLVTTFLMPKATMETKHFDWAFQTQLAAGAIFGQQDIEANTIMQEGFKSRFVRPGRYSYLEATLPQFNSWLLPRYLRGLGVD